MVMVLAVQYVSCLPQVENNFVTLYKLVYNFY